VQHERARSPSTSRPRGRPRRS